VRIDLANGLAMLDATAAIHHGLVQDAGRIVAIEFWLSLLSEADQQRVHSLVCSDLHADRTVWLIVRLRWPSEDEPVRLELAFRLDANSGHIVGVCRDVTDVQSLEELSRRRDAAERSSQAKSEFMSQVSHELRTPLNSILGFAQLMEMDVEQPISGKQQERLRVLQRSGLRLLALVDQLLQIGKIEQGKLNLRLRSVNLRPLIRRCVDAMTPMAEERGIAIAIDLGDDDSAAVRADANALEQVLINLLSNGIKYNRQGGRLTVKYRNEDTGEITVDDTGHGLTASQIARLFEPFNRLDAAQSGIQGTGLGLTISRQLVEAMRGTLQVWSEVDVGSCFRVALPRARGMCAKDAETIPLDTPSQWSTVDGFRVLYIEDDDVNVVLMDQLFATQPEWSLTTAMTGEAGLVEAIRQQPDFILLDMTLPDMTGWEVRKRLKLDRRTRCIPVIAVSADAMPENQRRSRSCGFADYWTKPLDLPVTIRKLKALCAMVSRR
jgi:signal transduction histidine kinase